MLLYQTVASTRHGKNTKISNKNNKFKVSAPKWNEKLELSIGNILYQIFKIILIIFKKKKTWRKE